MQLPSDVKENINALQCSTLTHSKLQNVNEIVVPSNLNDSGGFN